MAESHQPPYSLQPPPPQQHQSMAPWYGGPPQLYQPQQAPAPPMQHHSMPWTSSAMPPRPPPGDQAYGYVPQQYHAPPQAEFYPRPQQVHHHYLPPPQHGQPQFTYMHGQQDQVWHQANNSWTSQQWPHPAQTASLSQEEVWAAKARAWAASKAIQDEPMPNSNVPEQPHPGYSVQPREPTTTEGLQPSLQPPGQEVASIHNFQDNMISQGQSVQVRNQSEHPQILAYNHRFQDTNPLIPPKSAVESFDHKEMQAGNSHAIDGRSMLFASIQVNDAAASYGPEASVPGPQGNEAPLFSEKRPTNSISSHQATPMLPQSQAPPLMSQPHFPFSDKVSDSGYEQRQRLMPSSYLQPPPPPNLQQPPAQVLHQPQKPPPQNHYPASAALDGVEGDFGLSPGSLQNWAPVGGPGMPFPPAMGAGTSQFDPVHGPHQLSVSWRPDGPGLQALGFPNSTPFTVATSPGLGPGSGPPIRPLFAPESFVERPKKAAVPSWLREELLKKKSAGLTGNASGMLSLDESSRVNGGEPANNLGLKVGISDKLRGSSHGLSGDEEEDQEEEIEAARILAINQEIKRLLTEVLLKVTGDLFKEIAQEVIDEDSDDMVQGEQSSVEKSASPLSPMGSPAAPAGRVFVSSGRNLATDDNARDKDSSDSGGTAGDVLGLGNYGSDDEINDLQDNDAKSPQVNTDTRNPVLVTRNPIDYISNDGNTASYGVPGPSQSSGPEHLVKDNIEGFTAGQMSGKQDTSVYHSHLQNCKSPVRVEINLSPTQAGKTARNELAAQVQVMPEQNVKGMNNSMLKAEVKSEDTFSGPMSEKNATCHSSLDVSLKKAENKETSLIGNTLMKDRKNSGQREDRVVDYTTNERRTEYQPLVESKNKGERDDRSKVKPCTSMKERRADERMENTKDVKRPRGSEPTSRDSSREKRKEVDKVKEKVKSRMKESDRNRKQDKKEREGRSRRREVVERKSRHRSPSPSSSAGRKGSSSSNTDRSRRKRVRTGRLSRHHTSTSSSGSSRKRRASRSRSRSRSRSPHVKHTHRRNVPFSSHEKSRRAGSKSPVHWRGHT